MIVSRTKAFSDLNFLFLIPNNIDAVSGRSKSFTVFLSILHFQTHAESGEERRHKATTAASAQNEKQKKKLQM
jgi:hypothetical protein